MKTITPEDLNLDIESAESDLEFVFGGFLESTRCEEIDGQERGRLHEHFYQMRLASKAIREGRIVLSENCERG